MTFTRRISMQTTYVTLPRINYECECGSTAGEGCGESKVMSMIKSNQEDMSPVRLPKANLWPMREISVHCVYISVYSTFLSEKYCAIVKIFQFSTKAVLQNRVVKLTKGSAGQSLKSGNNCSYQKQTLSAQC